MAGELPTISYRPLILTAVILLPPFFFAWYMSAPLVAMLTAWVLDPLFTASMPDVVHKVMASRQGIVVLTYVPRAGAAVSGHGGQGFTVGLLIYSYSLPLYAALAIASEESFRAHLWRLSAGLVILILVVFFSAGIHVLQIFRHGAQFQQAQVLPGSAWLKHLILYLHYLCTTILPSALPVVLWALFYRDTFQELVRLRHGNVDHIG